MPVVAKRVQGRIEEDNIVDDKNNNHQPSCSKKVDGNLCKERQVSLTHKCQADRARMVTELTPIPVISASGLTRYAEQFKLLFDM